MSDEYSLSANAKTVLDIIYHYQVDPYPTWEYDLDLPPEDVDEHPNPEAPATGAFSGHRSIAPVPKGLIYATARPRRRTDPERISPEQIDTALVELTTYELVEVSTERCVHWGQWLMPDGRIVESRYSADGKAAEYFIHREDDNDSGQSPYCMEAVSFAVCYALTKSGLKLACGLFPATKSRGRPKGPADPQQARGDRDIRDAWNTGEYKTFADLARVKGKKEHEIRLSLERTRKQESRRTGQ